MEKLIKQYDSNKLQALKAEIMQKNDELKGDINYALAFGNREEYNELKQLQLQCEAEIRLIDYIENELRGDFTIC